MYNSAVKKNDYGHNRGHAAGDFAFSVKLP